MRYYGQVLTLLNEFMSLAIEQAKLAAEMGETPIGAVIVKEGEVIAEAHNLREKSNSVLAHAEILAIEQATTKFKNWRLTNCDIYVTLEPCLMCAGAIIQSRMNSVYFGSYDTKNGALGITLDLSTTNQPHKIKVYGGIMENECNKVISDFFSKIR